METIEKLINMPNREIESLSSEEKVEYYRALYDYCASLDTGKPHITLVQKVLAKLAAASRKYSLEIRGANNIPRDGALIMCNHSNSHDAFTALEALSSVQLPASILATSDGLSTILIALFKGERASLLQRNNKDSSNIAICDMTSKLIKGDTCIVFGEGTWNLHPLFSMQNIRIGGAKMAAISQKPIVPAIFEYVEVSHFCKKENELFKKVIVVFCKPYLVDTARSLIAQTKEIQEIMEQTRRELWRENGIKRDKIEEIDVDLYINHTGLKVYGGLGEFDYEREKSCLLSVRGEPVEFMYTLDENDNFVPGELTKAVFERVTNRHSSRK